MYRYNLIQYLIDKYGLKSYLEIGTQHGQTFKHINCKMKIGIDPHGFADGVIRTTSNEFFNSNSTIFDIIFIDGLHLHEQTILDMVNSWNCLSVGGFIVIHDCLPTCKEMCGRSTVIDEWTGDVWKAVVWFVETYPEIKFNILDIDYGCGIIRKDEKRPLVCTSDLSKYAKLDFEWLQSNLDKLHIIKTIQEF